jgi:tetratricopeptide (TPR) repeat protein
MIRFVITLVLGAGLLASQTARTAPGDLPRQAKTPEEFDLYLDFDEAHDAAVKHRAALNFEQFYPQSELLVYVYQSELEYARTRNLTSSVVSVGEKALALAPDNIPVLLALAEVMPNGELDSRLLDRSEAYARRALDLSESRHVSPQLTLDDCDNLRRKIRSRAYAALGLAAMKRGAVPLATQEFERAVAENPETDGVQLYRLAKLYLTSGRRANAAALFQKAFQAGPPEISTLAAAELSRER